MECLLKFEIFSEQLKAAVQARLGEEVKVLVTALLLPNENEENSMTFFSSRYNISPALPLSDLYQKYQEGYSIPELAEKIENFYLGGAAAETMDLSFFENFPEVKDRIFCRLINYEKNRLLLEQVPHRRFFDLALVYSCKLTETSQSSASILIRNSHLTRWNIKEEQLYQNASRNNLREESYELLNLFDVLEELTQTRLEVSEEEQAADLFVLSNREKCNGAVAMIFEQVLRNAGEKIGGDYFILPSSIHECMVVPASEKICAFHLHALVREMNKTFVKKREILGDSIYRYHQETGVLSLCEF